VGKGAEWEIMKLQWGGIPRWAVGGGEGGYRRIKRSVHGSTKKRTGERGGKGPFCIVKQRKGSEIGEGGDMFTRQLRIKH